MQIQGGVPQPRAARPGAQRRRRGQHFGLGLGAPALGWRSMPTLPSPEQRRKKRSRRSETVAAVARLKEARTSRVASERQPSFAVAGHGTSRQIWEGWSVQADEGAADCQIGDCQDWFKWTPRGCSTHCNGLGWAGPCSTAFGPNGLAFFARPPIYYTVIKRLLMFTCKIFCKI